MSEDGNSGLVIIGFVGSVFSPYYAWARRRENGDPENHCVINVALYGKTARRWCMTERGRDAMQRSASTFEVGRSRMEWQDGRLVITIDEFASPLPFRITGRVVLTPDSFCDTEFPLDDDALHYWRPVVPRADIEVDLDGPRLSWRGHAYHDMNWGIVPLEDSFTSWTWSRSTDAESPIIYYDVEQRDGPQRGIAVRIDSRGHVDDIQPPCQTLLPPTLWRLSRSARSGSPARHLETFEDAPFYARSLIATRDKGEESICVHESLSLDRFQLLLVQAMLPFRMPRWSR